MVGGVFKQEKARKKKKKKKGGGVGEKEGFSRGLGHMACYTRGAGSRRSCGVWGRRVGGGINASSVMDG